jgi:hypothetical protein
MVHLHGVDGMIKEVLRGSVEWVKFIIMMARERGEVINNGG